MTALLLSSAASGESAAARSPSVSPQYRIKLGPFVAPPTRTVGLIAQVRINGGPALRLLLDSGTQYVVLSRKAALSSGCPGGADLDLVGPGALSPNVVKRQRAGAVQVGDLSLRDVPILITDRPLAEGIHGVLPLSIFAGFLIRLDVPGKNLDLLPYPGDPEDPAGALATITNNELIFLKGTVNGVREGYFLLDTGASYNAISQSLARQLKLSDPFADREPLRGGTVDMEAPLLRGAVHLRLGSRQLPGDSVVALDLSLSSRYHQLEISGLIGYPALHDSVVTLSYRDNLVRIEPR